SRCPGSVGYGLGPVAPFVFYGDPGNSAEWSMCACKSPLQDRRFIHSSGPFTLKAGEKNDITIGVVWVDDAGACGTGSFKKIRSADDIAQALFDQGFRRTVGPEAPLLTIREMDKKLIFYINNPANSNNFNEQYGDPKFANNPVFTVTSAKAKAAGVADSIYRFEGYRVFQLRGPNVSLFDENGNLTADAVEVFQTDRKNGVSQIANFEKNLEVKSPIDQFNTIIKVNGKDSGIVHSFVLTEDAFATGDKTLVNYKTYYYVAVAYAYNNFSPFDPANEVTSQDKAYLIGDNGPGSTAIMRYPAMPNSMNQKGDTFSNAAYGDGVIITRIEGIGNGGNDVQLDDTTEASILLSATNQASYPTYKAGKGPVNIKVIDPVKVVASDWRISLTGPILVDANAGLDSAASGWRIDRLDGAGNVIDTIYSERDLTTANEQILAKYGLSVEVGQVKAPGVQPKAGNGYITSDVTFANTSIPWLGGVADQPGRSLMNWIRSGTFIDEIKSGEVVPCNPFDDYKTDPDMNFGTMFASNTNLLSTWAPYDLVATVDGTACGFAPALPGTVGNLYYSSDVTAAIRYSEYPNVDLVFTSDRSKWTRCVVLEAQFTSALAEGKAGKLKPRSHKSWNGEINGDNEPVYSTVANDTGMSYFPGYAINQLTGERLNIAFSEDSYLKQYNGADMLWNPTSDIMNLFQETVFGGRHFTYIMNTKYDSCKSFITGIKNPSVFTSYPAYRQIRWVGVPLLTQGSKLLSLKDGLIPTETRLRFRVNTPYKQYKLMPDQVAVNSMNPMYRFSTAGMAPTDYTSKTDADALLDRVFAVPNPYKGQASGGNTYESNRLETKIKIINLPQKATINIYSLDGTLVRRLEKDNNEPAITWDLYNQAGLPIASGMYLIHVNAYGKDRVLRWFGAMRPLDVTNN
ncbi:MAG: T9SS type A sorting domain-containing protein, partial [Chitinophagaceae bacterium]|nr:T9SS type A sorting domain-containing protein [Chitinophagaceae bacterium]